MATKTTSIEEHRRKILLNNLSPKTTKDSLEEYFSGFEIEAAWSKIDERRSNGYGFVLFRKESSVNAVMSRRPHVIDGQRVELYRSVPDQGPLKDTKGITELIVSGFERGLITTLDLQRYFCGFGKINNINTNDNDDSYCIEFDDYDSVDKVLLDKPHTIKSFELQLTKASRKRGFEASVPSKVSPSVVRKGPKSKPMSINPDRSDVNLPNKIYCIHITNFATNVDAESVSKQLNWSMGNILMSSSTNKQSSSVECWLKGFDKLQTAEDFVETWDGQIILKSKIDCSIEEDRLELCYKFRIGTCPMASDVCYWEHTICTANGKCPNDCPYGHREGIKSAFINDSKSNDSYQIRIAGFQKKLTQDILSQTLNEKNCFVDPSEDFVGYIGPLKTMKHARRLFAKWHNKVINEQRFQCQIEWNRRSSMSRTSSNAGSTTILTKNDSRTGTRDNFPSSYDSDSEIRVLDDKDINCEARLFDRSIDIILKQKEADKTKPKSSINLPSPADRKSQSLNEISEGIRKMTMIRKKTLHGSYVFLIEYNKTHEEMHRRELHALWLLKGVKGVVQLVDVERSLNDDNLRSGSRSDLSIVTECAPGCNLKKFFSQIHRGDVGVLQAIQIIQNLITIVKQVHDKGVLHQNLGPESVLIEWDSKQAFADQAQLFLIDFSQACIISEKDTRTTAASWYKARQANVESFKYSSTIDASSICGILLWLLTTIDPRHDQNKLPHQQDNVIDKLNKKITQATRHASKLSVDESQLKRYLIDTFDIGFGYPQFQPWTINDLECRLESIREILSPKNPRLNTTEAVFKQLASALRTPLPTSSPNIHQDVFQKAAMALQEAKQQLSKSSDRYLWSDGGCTWLDSTTNEHRHDDILTFNYRDGHMAGSCSVIITCLATLIDEDTYIALSISSPVNGKISRIPIGCYSKTQNFTKDLQNNFIIELDNLIKSVAKERSVRS